MTSIEVARSANWYLEGLVGDSATPRHVAINAWPFCIGRQADLAFSLLSNNVSKRHAEIRHDGRALWIRDLGSRNGTFVNGKRIDCETRLEADDVLHFADLEFRVGCHSGASAGATMDQGPNPWVLSIRQFAKIFGGDAAVPHFQPIVRLPRRDTIGYEVLARSNLDGLQSAQQLFSVAARLQMEEKLSRLFRQEGVRVGQSLPESRNLFLNTHPVEMGTATLLESLRELRVGAPEQPMTLEIHEAAVTDSQTMRELRAVLGDLDIQLAYDDFGAGQARLLDLIEVPPDYLKFDIKLVRDIHLASDQHHQMVRALVGIAHDLGVAVLAEGIEQQLDGDICAEIGFDYAQGYLYGHPLPA